MEKAKPVSKGVVKDVKQMALPYHTDKTDDFTAEEVNLANRCHGLHLEGLDLALTPAGMHYLLIHFDIPTGPATAEATYRLKLRGLVDRPLELSMADIRRRPRVSIPVTMECAGNGRINMKKRYLQTSSPPSPPFTPPLPEHVCSGFPFIIIIFFCLFRYWTHVPWQNEALGTAVWTGTPLKDLLDEAGLQDKAIELLFTGLDKGLQGGEMQYYQRCLTIDDATREEVCTDLASID